MSNDKTYWRRKLSAFMHDNPAKPLDVKEHEMRAFLQQKVDQLESHEEYDNTADHEAAAADRLPFPHAGKMRAGFDGVDKAFHHPLDGNCRYRSKRRLTADLIDEISQGNRTVLDESDPRADFIARWRFWREWTAEREPSISFFPADTRIPDHSIWNHMSLTSAFQGCLDRDPERQPALLLFSIGPVQPLIAAARRIGDLWSGSYLLSYLVASALGEVARRYGPDHIIFPSAHGQPLVDLQLKEIYKSAKVRSDSESSLWEQLWTPEKRQQFLTPSLPNRFLVLLPHSEAGSVAAELSQVIRSKLHEIGDSVAKAMTAVDESVLNEHSYFPERIPSQLDATLDIYWRTLPIPKTLEEAKGWAADFLPRDTDGDAGDALASLERLERMWKTLPKGYHTSYGLRNGSTAWPVLFSLVSWALDAVKNTRTFRGWGDQPNWQHGRTQNKDQLTGKEESVLMVSEQEDACQELCHHLPAANANTFKPGERLGALTLVKRLWHRSYLEEAYGFQASDFRMPDTHALAKGFPFSQEKGDDPSDEAGYIAVIALDGDEMGKWVSGSNTPPLKSQLAEEALKYFQENLKAEDAASSFLDAARPLNPSFHLQFSEALASFSIHAARWIVEHFSGRLIYAGGDDVLAIVPASQGLACVHALRAAFRGESRELKEVNRCWVYRGKDFSSVDTQGLFDPDCARGFIRSLLTNKSAAIDRLVPGPRADVSTGIAIGHAKAPLQDLVRAAQAAEKRAKNDYGRASVAFSIFKRSGEEVHWGCRWAGLTAAAGHGLDLLRLLISERDRMGHRFAYKLMQLLYPYIGRIDAAEPDAEMDASFIRDMDDVILLELKHCLRSSKVPPDLRDQVLEAFSAYWNGVNERLHLLAERAPAESPEAKEASSHAHAQLLDFYGLLQVVAWTGKDSQTADQREPSMESVS